MMFFKCYAKDNEEQYDYIIKSENNQKRKQTQTFEFHFVDLQIGRCCYGYELD